MMHLQPDTHSPQPMQVAVSKDEKAKVSTRKIIFSNKTASKKFEKALVDFDFKKNF
ncbi:hypothetical protein HA149_06285 [Prochlorococcus marinus XMU1406]|uniref:hypothetical protein n=1 Tax=Prochlorococcus marinus TaxID=1219 RepID=UPI001ADC09B5|nr:hypothetical protein [Prochlorococcus marinus]MBO8206669.1 hypothetical protein [Prochlorococcus marinus XMU1406]MCR8544277.1 hypothetical protein [Prochlorococcus marinus XMU1427]